MERFLALTLLVGAARADADEFQLAGLRNLHLGACMRAGGDVEFLAARVRAVMGRDWEPSGDWARQLEALGGI